MKNQLRIIAGEWRGRKVVFPPVAELRPTPSRVKETLFNWLRSDVVGARCLDLFAGSGGLGLEAASRGARSVLLVDQNRRVCETLKNNLARLGAHQVTVRRADVMRFLHGPAEPFDVVFLDPPFRRRLAAECCRMLEARGWLAPDARIYVETATSECLEPRPQGWSLLRSKKAGGVGYHLFERTGEVQ